MKRLNGLLVYRFDLKGMYTIIIVNIVNKNIYSRLVSVQLKTLVLREIVRSYLKCVPRRYLASELFATYVQRGILSSTRFA